MSKINIYDDEDFKVLRKGKNFKTFDPIRDGEKMIRNMRSSTYNYYDPISVEDDDIDSEGDVASDYTPIYRASRSDFSPKKRVKPEKFIKDNISDFKLAKKKKKKVNRNIRGKIYRGKPRRNVLPDAFRGFQRNILSVLTSSSQDARWSISENNSAQVIRIIFSQYFRHRKAEGIRYHLINFPFSREALFNDVLTIMKDVAKTLPNFQVDYFKYIWSKMDAICEFNYKGVTDRLFDPEKYGEVANRTAWAMESLKRMLQFYERYDINKLEKDNKDNFRRWRNSFTTEDSMALYKFIYKHVLKNEDDKFLYENGKPYLVRNGITILCDTVAKYRMILAGRLKLRGGARPRTTVDMNYNYNKYRSIVSRPLSGVVLDNEVKRSRVNHIVNSLGTVVTKVCICECEKKKPYQIINLVDDVSFVRRCDEENWYFISDDLFSYRELARDYQIDDNVSIRSLELDYNLMDQFDECVCELITEPLGLRGGRKKKLTNPSSKPKTKMISVAEAKKRAKQSVTDALKSKQRMRGHGNYLGNVGKQLGKLIGGKKGGRIGKGVGNLANAVIGSGNYSTNGGVETNRLVNNGIQDNIPHFSKGNGSGIDGNDSITVCFTEYVLNLKSPTVPGSFQNIQLAVNPGLSQLFRWLSQLAPNYTQYRFEGLIFIYIPNVGVVTEGNMGFLTIAPQYNPADPAPTSKETINFLADCKTVRVNDTMVLGLECDRDIMLVPQGRYIRAGAVPVGQDVKTYDLAAINFGLYDVNSTAFPPGSSLGEIRVSYKVTLIKPKLWDALGNALPSDYFWGKSSCSLTLPLGNSIWYSANNTIGGSVTKSTSTIYTFPDEFTGTVRVLYGTQATSPVLTSSSIVLAGNITSSALLNNSNFTANSQAWACSSSTTSFLCRCLVVNAASTTGGNTLTFSIDSGSAVTGSWFIIEQINPLIGPPQQPNSNFVNFQ